jgi:hypothetical protein
MSKFNLVVLVFVRPKLKVIGQMSRQVKYLFAALIWIIEFIDLACSVHCWPSLLSKTC